MKALWAVIVLTSALGVCPAERYTVLTPDERNSRPGRVLYYRPAPAQAASVVPWEEPLKQAVHLALHGANGVHDAPYVGARDGSATAHRFGDVAVLARGRLLRTREGGFRFLENDRNNDCEGCHVAELDNSGHGIRRRGNEDHGLAAVWSVRRVRHRDPVRGHRYELQFTITPMDDRLHSTETGSANERRFIVRDDDYPSYFRALIQQQNNQYDKRQPIPDERYRYTKLYDQGDIRKRPPLSLNTNEYYAGDKNREKYLHAADDTQHPDERILAKEPTGRRVRFPGESQRDQRFVYQRDPDEQVPQSTRVRYGTTSEFDPDNDDLRHFKKLKPPAHITHLHHHHYYIGKPDIQTLPVNPKLLQDEYIPQLGAYHQPSNLLQVLVPNAIPSAVPIKFPTTHHVSTTAAVPIATYRIPEPVRHKLTPTVQIPSHTVRFQYDDARRGTPVTFVPSEPIRTTKFSEPDPLYNHNTPPALVATQVFPATESSISEPLPEGYYVTVLPHRPTEVNCTTNDVRYAAPTQLLPTHDYEETRTEPMQAITAQSSSQYDTKTASDDARPPAAKSQVQPPQEQTETTLPFSTPVPTTERTKVTRGRVTRVKLSTTSKPTASKSKWVPRRNRPKQRNRNNRPAFSTTMSSFEVLDTQTDAPNYGGDEKINIISIYNTTEMFLSSDTKNTAFTENYNSLEISTTTQANHDTVQTANTIGTVMEPSTSLSNSTSISYQVGNSTVVNKESNFATTTEPSDRNSPTTVTSGTPKIYEVFKNESTTRMPPEKNNATRYRKQRTKYRSTTERPNNANATLEDLTLSILNHARRESLLNKA